MWVRICDVCGGRAEDIVKIQEGKPSLDLCRVCAEKMIKAEKLAESDERVEKEKLL